MSGLSGAVTSVAVASGMGRVGMTVVGAVTGGVSELYNQVKSGGDINWSQVAIRTAGGAVSGFIMGNASSGSKAAEEVAKKTVKQIAKESVGVFAQTTATTFVEDYAYNRAGGYSRGDSAKSALFTSVISGFTDASLYSLGEAVSSMCFVAGTMVLTAEGLVAIESIAVGDIVIATDPETGETEEKEVVETYVNETEELIHVWIDGEEIVTTPTHPFYVPEKGWTYAVELKAGDQLQLVNGEYVTVEKVQHELLEEPVKVYNFQVEDFHTYYVGTDVSVLVHNDCDEKVKSSSIHGNSKKSTKKNHVYVIVDDNGDMVKVGISGQNLNKNGTSPRANSQVSSFNKKGMNTHAIIVETDLTRKQALDLEQKITDKHTSRNEGAMPSQYHKRPKSRADSTKKYVDLYGESPNKSTGGRY